MTSPDISLSVFSVGGSLSDVLQYALAVFTGNVAWFVLFLMMSLAMAFYINLLRMTTGMRNLSRSHRSRFLGLYRNREYRWVNWLGEPYRNSRFGHDQFTRYFGETVGEYSRTDQELSDKEKFTFEMDRIGVSPNSSWGFNVPKQKYIGSVHKGSVWRTKRVTKVVPTGHIDF